MQLEALQNINLQAFFPDTASSAKGDSSGATQVPEVPRGSQPTLTDAIIQFVNDQKSGRVLLQIVQPKSGEVIRQIPSENELAITQRLGQVLDKVV